MKKLMSICCIAIFIGCASNSNGINKGTEGDKYIDQFKLDKYEICTSFFDSTCCAHENSRQNIKSYFYANCKSLADIECLKENGWKFKIVTIEDISDTLSIRTVPIFQKLAKEFISNYKIGDKTLIYSTPKTMWEREIGREGYIIIRNDTLVAEITTVLN
jgi:hypothetical protein